MSNSKFTSVKGQPTVAWCFYGQYRTADYTMPWLQEMVKATPCTKAIFCSTKVTNVYPNSLVDLPSTLTVPARARASLEKAFPGIELDVSCTVQKNLAPELGYWHYARMIWSMNKVIQMYNFWAKDNGDVDFVVLARLDGLVGPLPASLGDWFKDQRPSFRDIWTSPGTTHFIGSELGVGIGDLLVLGTPTSINSVLAYTMECLLNEPRKGWIRFRHGPNIMLKNAADVSSLIIHSLPIKVALVRPNADLSIPVLDSFNYHKQFWQDNHKAMATK